MSLLTITPAKRQLPQAAIFLNFKSFQILKFLKSVYNVHIEEICNNAFKPTNES